MLELMLAMAVGSIVIAGTFAANVIVAKQYERICAFSQTLEMAIPSMNLIVRDLRMAGNTALDANANSPFGAISIPITITDSGNACCDAIQIIYDTDPATRKRISYFVAVRHAAQIINGVNFPAENGLYMQVETWTGADWNVSTANSLVADYIEDLQFKGLDPDTNGNPRIVDMFTLFRSKSLLPQNATYTKPPQTVGNYNYSFTDRYYRDTFSATINIRNLR